MDVDVELDRRVMTVRQILALDLGSVVRMNRSAGENLDVRVGGALLGFGEIVVNEATTGIRLTDFFQNV
jgi:flagellar motor switch protein FliN/FliY